MQQQDHVWQLVAGCLSGNASPEELEALQLIMHNDPVFKNTVELLFHFFYSSHYKNPGEIEDAWQRHEKRIGAG
jgi:hypothetical protein